MDNQNQNNKISNNNYVLYIVGSIGFAILLLLLFYTVKKWLNKYKNSN